MTGLQFALEPQQSVYNNQYENQIEKISYEAFYIPKGVKSLMKYFRRAIFESKKKAVIVENLIR